MRDLNKVNKCPKVEDQPRQENEPKVGDQPLQDGDV